jgi:hypothetical protein
MDPSVRTDGVGDRRLPGLGDQIVMSLQHAAQFSRTPVRTAVGRRLLRLGQHARFHRRGQYGRRPAAVARAQPLEAVGHKTTPPPIDVILVARLRGLDHRAQRASASISSTRARRASSARILRLRTGRSSSARSSLVNVSAMWRQTYQSCFTH